MKNPNKPISLCLIAVLLLACIRLPAEAIDDRFTEVVPSQTPDHGEYYHGRNYGKVLIRVLMFGSVPSQGVHFVPEGTDLLFAILYAGGYGESSKLNGITIRRKNLASIIKVNLEDLIEDGQPVPKLLDGDVVTVPWSWRKGMETVSVITGFLAGLTGLTLSVIALSRTH